MDEIVKTPTLLFTKSWNENSLSPEQFQYYSFLNHIDGLFNLAMYPWMDMVKGENQNILLSKMCRRFADIYDLETSEKCSEGKRFSYGDYSQIAHFIYPSIKSIIESPNKEIMKVEMKVKAEKFRETTSKTIMWLSKRPGIDIHEKISPDNKIQTSVRKFTADTKENQASVYLCNELIPTLESEFTRSECLTCSDTKGKPCHLLRYEIQRLLHLKRDLRYGELKDVKSIKQPNPNNKLMTDPRYRSIRYGTKKLDELNGSDGMAVKHWENLVNRLVCFYFLALSGFVLRKEGSRIEDCYVTLKDKGEDIYLDADGSILNKISIINTSGVSIDKIIISRIDKNIEVVIKKYSKTNYSLKPTELQKSYSFANIANELRQEFLKHAADNEPQEVKL